MLLLSLNGSDSLLIDGIFWTITKTFTWLPLFASLLYVIFKNNDMRKVLFILAAVVLLVLITDQFSSSVCKPFFQRLRPSRNPSLYPYIDLVSGYKGGMYGFISSHAANTFGVAVFFSLLFRRLQSSLVLFFWAFLSSYSRIYLGVHYPGDIFFGALWGLLSGVSVYYIMQYLIHRNGGQRCFYSSAFTESGYLRTDLVVVSATFSLSLVYVIIRAVFYSSVF